MHDTITMDRAAAAERAEWVDDRHTELVTAVLLGQLLAPRYAVGTAPIQATDDMAAWIHEQDDSAALIAALCRWDGRGYNAMVHRYARERAEAEARDLDRRGYGWGEDRGEVY